MAVGQAEDILYVDIVPMSTWTDPREDSTEQMENAQSQNSPQSIQHMYFHVPIDI